MQAFFLHFEMNAALEISLVFQTTLRIWNPTIQNMETLKNLDFLMIRFQMAILSMVRAIAIAMVPENWTIWNLDFLSEFWMVPDSMAAICLDLK